MFSPPSPIPGPCRFFGGRHALGSRSGFVTVSHGPGSSLGGHCLLCQGRRAVCGKYLQSLRFTVSGFQANAEIGVDLLRCCVGNSKAGAASFLVSTVLQGKTCFGGKPSLGVMHGAFVSLLDFVSKALILVGNLPGR